MVEAIWGQDKSAAQIASILLELHGAGELALVTRMSPAKVRAVERELERMDSQSLLPLQHHPDARCLVSPSPPPADRKLGEVVVLGGGSSDRTVASEARLALACHGVASRLVLDVGVAGLHRLLDQLEGLRDARVLIACAGMEGALPTVLAGLLPQPVIGVPVSVGYGVSAGGMAALHGMLASCAPGLTVVNVDNGYGAAMAALRILQLGLRGAAAGDRR
jgi:NCAIR mutase (PurE)-related protein